MKKLLITLFLVTVAVVGAHANSLTPAQIAKIQNWAAADAVKTWPSLRLIPGSDGNFNFFEVGMRASEAAEGLAARRGISEDSEAYQVYETAYSDAITQITTAIQERANSKAQPWKHLGD